VGRQLKFLAYPPSADGNTECACVIAAQKMHSWYQTELRGKCAFTTDSPWERSGRPQIPHPSHLSRGPCSAPGIALL